MGFEPERDLNELDREAVVIIVPWEHMGKAPNLTGGAKPEGEVHRYVVNQK